MLADWSAHSVDLGFPLPTDVNRALWGGGVPEDRTPTVQNAPELLIKYQKCPETMKIIVKTAPFLVFPR